MSTMVALTDDDHQWFHAIQYICGLGGIVTSQCPAWFQKLYNTPVLHVGAIKEADFAFEIKMLTGKVPLNWSTLLTPSLMEVTIGMGRNCACHPIQYH
jgi:hypothetical protein